MPVSKEFYTSKFVNFPYQLDTNHAALRASANLKLYLKMETGALLVDSSVNNNTVSNYNNNVVESSSGKFGYCGNFGSNNAGCLYVSGGVGLAGNGDQSISMWIKLGAEPAANESYTLLNFYSTVGADRHWSATYEDVSGVKQLIITENTDTAYVVTLGTSAWHHIVFEIDNTNSKQRIYLDGALVAEAVNSAAAGSAANFVYIGATSAGFEGLMDDVSIWNKALTALEVKEIYAFTAAYYRFSAGALTTDSGPFAHTLVETENIYNYTKSLLHFEGSDAATTFTDESGKTWTAYGNAQIDTAQKKFGSASGLFDGSGDYIDTPTSSDHEPAAGDFTVDLWVRFNATTGTQTLFARRTLVSAAQKDLFACYFASNVLTFQCLVNGVEKAKYTKSWTPSTATWYHLAFVRNGTTFYLFIDGVSQSPTEVTAISTNDLTFVNSDNNKLTLARYGNYDGFYFNGWLDEFRFTKGLARWTANFTPPTVAYPLPQTENASGVFDGAVTLSLPNGAYSTPSGADLKPLGKFTLSGWFKTTATTNQGIFQSWSQATNCAGFRLIVIGSTGAIAALLGKNTGSTLHTDYENFNGGSVATDGNWHHAVLTFDGTYATLYLDGAQVAQVSWTAMGYETTNYVRVGCTTDTGLNTNHFAGSLDDIFLINGFALSADDVLYLYRQTKKVGAVGWNVIKKLSLEPVASVKKVGGLS